MDSADLKRALIAIVLSFVALLTYQYFFVPESPREVPKQKTEEPAANGRQAEEEKGAVQKEKEVKFPSMDFSGAASSKSVTVETPLYIATFSSRGAVVKKWELKEYVDDQKLPLVLARSNVDIAPLTIGYDDTFKNTITDFAVVGDNLVLSDANPDGTITFVHEEGQGIFSRTMTFHADSYRVDVKDETRGTGNYWVTLGEGFGLTGAEGVYAHIGPVILQGTDRDAFKPKKIKEPRFIAPDNLKWIAMEDKYFFSSLVPFSEVANIKLWRKEDSGMIAVKMPEGKSEYAVFAGPKVINKLKVHNLGMEHIVDFGFWSFIARPIFWLLLWINGFIRNFGWSIILLTILIRIPFIPLLNKGQASMKKMQAIQPKMAEIKEKYKKDPQKMQKEMMELYRKNKVNPMGGCLPMLVQIPVFFALYKVLLVAIEMRQAPWILWIHDLSAKDPYYVLPIVMGATMFLQQKMTPSSADPRQAKIMMIMPVVFTFMFLNFSSGLVLYWLMSNVLSIVQQIFVNRKIAAEQAAAS